MEKIISLNRFDLIAKFLYIKYYSNYNIEYYFILYKKHIDVFNKNWEYPGTKTNIKDFITSFNNLIESFKNKGFETNTSVIQIGNNNVLINGAHRLMISFYLNINPKLTIDLNSQGSIYNYDFFRNRNNYWRRDNKNYNTMNEEMLDNMALEFIKIKNNIRCIVFYPIINIKYDENKKKIFDILKKYGIIGYEKQIELNKNGVCNLIKELYRGESWIGGMFPNDSCGGKFDLCIDKQSNSQYINLILLQFDDLNKCINCKEELRNIFNIKKNSLHIPDTQIETFRICSSLLNENSIYFLNNGTNNLSCNTKKNLIDYYNKLQNNQILDETEKYCLTSSLVMELFNLRNAKDLDYLNIYNEEKFSNKNISIHNKKWLTYYTLKNIDIIFDPTNHFYLNGFKIVSIDIIKNMKQNRNEDKDKIDIKLIDSLYSKINK